MRVKGQRQLKVSALAGDGFKAAEEGEEFVVEGYGSVFGVVDSYGEVVAKGAFTDSLREIKATGRPLPMLWQHRSGTPIGVWTELRQDDRGLYQKGRLIKGVQAAEEARLLAMAGAVSGLSIGYWVRDDSTDEKTRVTTLKKLDLVETSLVTFPANDDARVDAVKFALAHGGIPTVRDFETVLRREVGLSKSQARIVVSKGFAALARMESDAEAVKQIVDAAAGLDDVLEAASKPLF